jgi:hypothetical protein
MDLENIMLNEINQTRKDKYHKSHMQNLDFFFSKRDMKVEGGLFGKRKGTGEGDQEKIMEW